MYYTHEQPGRLWHSPLFKSFWWRGALSRSWNLVGRCRFRDRPQVLLLMWEIAFTANACTLSPIADEGDQMARSFRRKCVLVWHETQNHVLHCCHGLW